MDEKFLKIATKFDEEFKPSDFTVEEIENLKTENNYKKIAINDKKKQKNTQIQKFKENYFAFYDDIKSSSLKKQDW